MVSGHPKIDKAFMYKEIVSNLIENMKHGIQSSYIWLWRTQDVMEESV